jgi:outer membrane protein
MKTLPLTYKVLAAAAWTAMLCLAASGAAAQELKIGYVNSERVLREAAPAKAAQARLEGEFSKREKELSEQGVRLKAAAERLEQ